MKKLTSLFFLLTIVIAPTQLLHAEGLEYTLDASARSYSPGLSVTPGVGYRLPLWGEAKSPFEGTVRPNFSVTASPATYSGRVELEFSPVMFINLSAGRTMQRVFSTFEDDLCRSSSCVGSLNSSDLSVRVLFKVSSIMGSLKYTRAFYDSKPSSSAPQIDPSLYVKISPNNEISDQLNAIIGTEINDVWSAGVLVQHTELEKNIGRQDGQYLLALMKRGQANYIAGAGRFESALKPAKPSVIFTFKYDWN